MRKSVKESLSIEYNISLYKKKPIFSFFKRLFDIVSSFLGLILLSWLFLIVAILVKCSSRGPIFYAQYRVGKNGKMFKIWEAKASQ